MLARQLFTLLVCSVASSLFSSCRSGSNPGGMRWYVEGAYSDRELEELTSEVVASGLGVIGEIEIADVEQERVGARFGQRGWAAEWHVQVFAEEFLGSGALDGFENVGFGGGGSGFAPFVGDSERFAFGLVWGADAALSVGNVDNGAVDQDLAYVDVDLSVGLGVDFRGIRPSAGVAVNSLYGFFSDNTEDEEGQIDALNVGGYVGVDAAPLDFPMVARLRVMLGAIDGVTVGLGVRF